MKTKLSIFFFFLLVIVSCKKEDVANYPVIYPGPYLPVYPGSYWKYITDTGDTTIQTTSDDYVLMSYYSNHLDGIKTDPVYVPYWNGEPVLGYSYAISEIPILKTTLNAGWCYQYSGSVHTSYGAFTMTVDTDVVVNSILYHNVIVVKKEHYSFSAFPVDYQYEFYAKNIGLIKVETHYINYMNYQWVQKTPLTILDYHINN